MATSTQTAHAPVQTRRTTIPPGRLAKVLLILVPICFLYAGTFSTLAADWLRDPDNSHGILIPPLVAYCIWLRRARLLAVEMRPARVGGLVVVLASLLLFFVGRLGAEFFLTRLSFIGLTLGLILFFAGRPLLRLLAFPLALLTMVIPVPALILNTIALPLQHLAAESSARFLTFCSVPVFRDGNVLHMADTSLGVAEACSGLRSLVSLFALSVILGYLRLSGWMQRLALVAIAVPLAIALNVLRIGITGLIANYWNVGYATGFYHTFSGWVMFVFAIALLFAFSWVIDRLLPKESAVACA